MISKMISNVKVPRSVFRIIFIFVSAWGQWGGGGIPGVRVQMSGAVELLEDLVICLSSNILQLPPSLQDISAMNYLQSFQSVRSNCKMSRM